MGDQHRRRRLRSRAPNVADRRQEQQVGTDPARRTNGSTIDLAGGETLRGTEPAARRRPTPRPSHRRVRSIGKRAEIGLLHPHMLRTAFITAALDAGVPLLPHTAGFAARQMRRSVLSVECCDGVVLRWCYGRLAATLMVACRRSVGCADMGRVAGVARGVVLDRGYASSIGVGALRASSGRPAADRFTVVTNLSWVWPRAPGRRPASRRGCFSRVRRLSFRRVPIAVGRERTSA